MYNIKSGVPSVEYSVFSVEYYWVLTGSKAWRKDLWRLLQNKSIIIECLIDYVEQFGLWRV
jgi:hypothetical protein